MAYERNDDGRGRYGAGRPGYGSGSYGQNSGRGRDGGDRLRGGGDDWRDRSSSDDDRGFIDRAGDEVRSWFGDENAEQRRERDEREAEHNHRGGYGDSSAERGRGFGPDGQRQGGAGRGGYGQSGSGFQSQQQPHHDPSYAEWRQRQIDALDRDYDEYRRENQSKFDTEFHGWRTQRQGQRSHLQKAQEHMEVFGSDGEKIGTVDKVRGDRIILTKNDPEAGGHHHSIPCSWIQSVDDKVMISKSATEAKTAWRDEERGGAMFGGGNDRDDGDSRSSGGPHGLNRAFSGTY